MSESKRGALPSSALPWQERTIGGVRYVVTRFGWWELLANLARAEDLLGPALVDVLKGGDATSAAALLSLPADVLGRAACELVRRFTSENGRALMRELGKVTKVFPEDHEVRLVHAEGDARNLDLWFGQHPGHVLEWLAFSCEVQFWDFFATPGSRVKSWLGQKGLLVDPASSPPEGDSSSSPNTSEPGGPSGD